jgi:hypothetical protein
VSFGWTSDDFGPDGHIGDPTGATAEHGKAVFEAAVTHLPAVTEAGTRDRRGPLAPMAVGTRLVRATALVKPLLVVRASRVLVSAGVRDSAGLPLRPGMGLSRVC